MKTVALAIFVLAAAEVFKSIYLGRKIHMSTITADQALQEFAKLISDLTAAVQNSAAEFAALLTAIKNNNGVNPGAIDGLVNQGEALVKNLNDAVAAAQSAVSAPPSVSISVSPTSASLSLGAQQQFSASVSGADDPTVKWSATNGLVDDDGLYVAPSAAGTDVVVATSNADPSKSASASVTFS